MLNIFADLIADMFRKELANPASAIGKKFQDMLTGDVFTQNAATQSTTKQATPQSSAQTQAQPQAANQNDTPLTEALDSMGLDEAVKGKDKKDPKNYHTPWHDVAVEEGLKGVGAIVKGVNDYTAAKHSILGAALLAAAKSAVPAQAAAMYGNPYEAGAIMSGVPHGAQAAKSTIIGNVINGVLGSTARNIRDTNEKNREVDLLVDEHPSGQFYDAQRKLTNMRDAYGK